MRKTGEWTSTIENNRKVISHPWAEKELNYLIQARILNVKDVKTFDLNAKVTKGAALEVIMKSISFIDPDYYYDNVALGQSLGLLTTSNNKFNPKQEVAYADLSISAVRLAHEVYKKRDTNTLLKNQGPKKRICLHWADPFLFVRPAWA